jgi:hypothetical protein
MKENKNNCLNENINEPHVHSDESQVLYNWYGKPNEITKPVLFFCAGVTITIIVGLIIQRFF